MNTVKHIISNIKFLKQGDIYGELWQTIFWDVINIIAFQIQIFFFAYAPQKILDETESIKKAVLDLFQKTSNDLNEHKRVIQVVFS